MDQTHCLQQQQPEHENKQISIPKNIVHSLVNGLTFRPRFDLHDEKRRENRRMLRCHSRDRGLLAICEQLWSILCSLWRDSSPAECFRWDFPVFKVSEVR